MSGAQQHNRVSVSIDDDVAWLTEQIDALRQLGSKDEVDEEECYDVSIRWGTALAGRLRRLVHYSSLSQLNDVDERRYQELCDELRSVSGLTERFGFAQPIFTDSPPASAKRQGPRLAKSQRELLRRGRAGSFSQPT